MDIILGRTPAETEEPLFGPDFLERLETLRILFAKASGLREGGRLGAFAGGQLLFRDYRAYAPGDDFRRVDWNAFLRTDRLFVKEYEREEAAGIAIWVDRSASMAFGEPSKWRMARLVAAMLAYIALCSHDIVDIRIFSKSSIEGIGPLGVPRDIHGVMAFLSKAKTGGGTDPAASCAGLMSGRGIGGLMSIFVISDFWCGEREVAALASMIRSHGHRLMALHVLSPEELALSHFGDLRVADSETGESVLVSTTPSSAQAYSRYVEEHIAAVERAFVSRGARHALIPADRTPEDVLIKTLKKKGAIA